MALTPRLGSSLVPSADNTVPSDIPNTQSDATMAMDYLSDGVLNKVAVDMGQYPKVHAGILGFVKGKRVPCTYYRVVKTTGANVRSHVADYATTINPNNVEYIKILNFEITLQKGFEFSANNETASGSMTATAYFYPNSNPSIADLVILPTGDGRRGIFRVSKIDISGWQNDRGYSVTLSLQSFMDQSDEAAFEMSVRKVLVFDKANFLGGTHALITEETYRYLQKIGQFRANLFRHFHMQFFDRDRSSYFRADAVYDPYVTKFMSKKISMDYNLPIPKNLMGMIEEDYRYSIWSRLEETFNPSLVDLRRYTVGTSYGMTKMSGFISELYDRTIVSLTSSNENGESSYVFSESFYDGAVSTMTSLESDVRTMIINRTEPDLGPMIDNYLSLATSLPKDRAFYLIPIYIHMCDMAKDHRFAKIDSSSMNYKSTE
jgi:hypothetical protein